jgi:hypothetical protein
MVQVDEKGKDSKYLERGSIIEETLIIKKIKL